MPSKPVLTVALPSRPFVKKSKDVIQSFTPGTVEPKKTLASRKSTIRLGTLVWAKLDKWPWWPGLIVPYEAVGMPAPKKPTNHYILWFGPTKTVSEMPVEKMSDFLDDNLAKLVTQPGQSPLLHKAVMEALRALSQSQSQQKMVNASDAKLVTWAIQHQRKQSEMRTKQVVLDRFPAWLDKSLSSIKTTNKNLKKIAHEKRESRLTILLGPKKKSVKAKNEEREEPVYYGPRDSDIAVVERIKFGSLDVENFCLGCHTEIMGPCLEHPLFVGGLCYRECKKELLRTSYGIGEDDIHVGCAVCGSTGKCVVCEKDSCSRVYCPYCVELLVGKGARATIIKQSPWFCFLCTPYSPETHGLLRPRTDWTLKLRSFLHVDLAARLQQLVRTSSTQSRQGRPKLRVVVLHDNLGAVEMALRCLRLQLDRYWASGRWEEVFEMNSVEFKLLKNARRWTDEQWGKLCPVHLLISCLPATEKVSSATSQQHPRPNPTGRQVGRRIFTQGDAGEAFLDFYRSKTSIQRHNGSTPLMWACESVGAYHILISRFLEMEPLIFNLKDHRGISNPRFVWTNITEALSSQFVEGDDASVNMDFSPACLGPRYREPFFVKYPWILEDIIACNQQIPASWFERKKRERFQRETRSRTKAITPPNYSEFASEASLPKKEISRTKKERSMPSKSSWTVPRNYENNMSEDEYDTASEYQMADIRSHARALGFPVSFTEFVAHLEGSAVLERLNCSLPISFWTRIIDPIARLAGTRNVK